MKLASYRSQRGDGIAVINTDHDTLQDLHDLWNQLPPGWHAPRTLLDLIEDSATLMPWLAQHLPAYQTRAPAQALHTVTLLPPVTRPSKIICLALNNSANHDRILQGPSHPATFIKPASALVGHGGAIELRTDDGRVHPEPELAVIIGQGGRDILPERAYDHVFGYTIHNDITGATLRGEDTFHYRAIHPASAGSLDIQYVDTWVSYPGRYKGSDTFACMGPWLVTADELPDPHGLDIACHHQGRLITADNTANLTHHTPAVIAWVSRYMTLWPGDIISLGTALKRTASGGAVQNIDLLTMGGPVSVTIQGIGTLENPVAVRPGARA